MVCPSCGAAVQDETCPKCGARVAPAPSGPAAGVETDVGLRAGAYLLDVIPAVLAIFAIGWIPIVGSVLLGIVLLDYWLLRDSTGSSLGKMILKLRVVKKDGSPSLLKERILRNVPFAIGPALLIVPVLSSVIAPAVAALFVLAETVLLWTKNQRMGDMLAGTTVVKKAAEKDADPA